MTGQRQHGTGRARPHRAGRGRRQAGPAHGRGTARFALAVHSGRSGDADTDLLVLPWMGDRYGAGGHGGATHRPSVPAGVAAGPAGRLAVRRDDPQVSAAAEWGVVDGVGNAAAAGARRFAHRLGERDQVVAGGWRRLELTVMPDKIPAARRGEAACVLLAQVVRVGFGKCGQRPDHRRRVGVDVGQRRNGRPGATVTGTAPWGPHGGTLSSGRGGPVTTR